MDRKTVIWRVCLVSILATGFVGCGVLKSVIEQNTGEEENLAEMRPEDLPKRIFLRNKTLDVTLNTSDGTLLVVDRRISRSWKQKALNKDMALSGAAKTDDGIDMLFTHASSGIKVTVKLRLDPKAAELTLELQGEGKLPGALAYPHPFVTESGTYLVIPMNEGISYPVDDESIKPRWLIAYGGHGICMGFWGVTDGEAAQMAIIETSDDALML